MVQAIWCKMGVEGVCVCVCGGGGAGVRDTHRQEESKQFLM